MLAGALIAPGCSTDHDAQPVVFRDSVGIRIVENHTPVWHPTEAWTIDPDPAVEIGVREGEPTYQLFRVYNALRLEDGRILVSNRGSSEVRFFDAAGRFLHAVGGRGGGPGEFSEFSLMELCRLPGERIAVGDSGHGRFHIFSTTGELLEVVRLQPTPDGDVPNLVGCFSGGSWLTLDGASIRADAGEVIREPVRYYRHATDGRVLERVAHLLGRPSYRNPEPGSMFPYVPLTAGPSVSASREALLVTAGGEPIIERRGLDGTLETVIRWPGEHRRSVDDVIERHREEAL